MLRPLSLSLLLLLAQISQAKAGVVEDWNEAFLNAVRKETPPPCLVSRNLPIFHCAVYRAVKAGVEQKLDEAQMQQVAHLACRQGFLAFFPSQTKMVEKLDASVDVSQVDPKIRAIVDEAVKRTLKEREGDGSSTTINYIPSDKPGQWRRTPPAFRPPEFPHWAKVKPFVVDDVTKFRAPPPPALDSSLYAEEVNEVRELGGKESKTRTAEQTMIAKFWADFSYTSSPAGHWNEIAREMCRSKKLPLAESARFFALLNSTLADTCITIWDTKYHYNFWRPVTAIRRADEDGNDATTADPKWEPLLKTPPHPDYVSGHSGISAAAATIMEHQFGKEGISFEASSDDVKETKRRFTSFQDCANEIARSRVYGGIHYSSAGEFGLKLGRSIALEAIKSFKE
ncbi:vanadium-dependent haloperoxidase [Brevifollis gellanilyticus]|uniref:Haloperoxidase n=1 Tax=Brevifollis gellanilyticus TaxID=748831 RepID=A0A512MBB0_9BACT|nr:vanadium-dependent haloperoxidase [Brevifollis gellanilyticus]GEP44020.1 haloperoxidase [Brevifollis gellanilyticus]